MKRIKYTTLSALAFFLAACGDDITNEEIIQQVTNVGSVETKSDLPDCDSTLSGQTAYIQKDSSFYGCNGKDWVKLNGSTISMGDNVCTSTALEKEDGFKIICNGTVIGTVHNGAKGEKGEKGDPGVPGVPGTGTPGKDGTSCSIVSDTTQVPNDLKVTIACGSETFTMDLSGQTAPVLTEDCEEGSEECVPMDNVKLSGESQKGPFVKGATIVAYELSDGKTLKQTGNNFNGTIESDKGLFNIKTVKLASQYAYLVAEGFYRNEVTGNTSTSPIKLRALTNLSSRSKANINLVTHLEYDRVVNLVTKNKMKVLDAKKQAEKEIFEAFGVDVSKFNAATKKLYAEDFNILSEGDGNAALLAISLLLQGNRTEAQLTAMLASLSLELGDDGVWGNLSDRAKIADWAMSKDLSKEGLGQFRDKINGWKSVEGMEDISVPAFEKYVRNFWMKELDVPECTVNGRIMNIGNSYSDFYAENALARNENTDKSSTRLICDISNGGWRFATDIEKDVGIGSHEDGYAQNGFINSKFVYVYEDGNWRYGTELDLNDNLQACTANRIGTTKKISETNQWYRCSVVDTVVNGTVVKNAWKLASETDILTMDWGSGEDGECRTVKTSSYTYDIILKEWRAAQYPECEFKLPGCTKQKISESYYKLSQDKLYYDQADHKNKNALSNIYVCTANGWIVADSRLNDIGTFTTDWGNTGINCYESENGQHTEDYVDVARSFKAGEFVPGRINAENKYVCDNNMFRVPTSREFIINKGCTVYNIGDKQSNNIVDYKCTADGWEPVKDSIKYSYAGSSTSNSTKYYKTVRIGKRRWFAENLNYYYSSTTTYTYNTMAANAPIYGRMYTLGGSVGNSSCNVYENNTTVSCPDISTENKQGICPPGWRIPTREDFDDLEYIAKGDGRVFNAPPHGTDDYGLSILMGGRYDYDPESKRIRYYGLDEEAIFWTSSFYWERAFEPNLYILVPLRVFYKNGFISDDLEAYKNFSDRPAPHRAYVRCVQDVP